MPKWGSRKIPRYAAGRGSESPSLGEVVGCATAGWYVGSEGWLLIMFGMWVVLGKVVALEDSLPIILDSRELEEVC
jgi:hypothetical protein